MDDIVKILAIIATSGVIGGLIGSAFCLSIFRLYELLRKDDKK